MSAPEVATIEARIRSIPLYMKTDDTPEPAYPYVVLYADGGIRSSDREGDVRVSKTIGWQTTIVGTSRGQVRVALDALTSRLEDWEPTATGRRFSKVEHEGSQPVRKDEGLPDRVLFIATDQWRVVSDPV